MNPAFVNAVEMLPLPKVADLAPDRIEGERCVWCGGAATVALGARLGVVGGKLLRLEPRSCRPCARREARRVYSIHITVCARCTHRDYCLDCKALYRLGWPPPAAAEPRAAAPPS